MALEAQLASLKAQASQSFANLQEHKLLCNKMPSYVIDEQDGSQHGLFQAQEMNECENNGHKQVSFSFDENFAGALEPHDMQDQDMEDLRSIAFAYLHHHA